MKQNDLNTKVKSLNYLKKKNENSILELLQKYEDMFDGTFSKYTNSDYIIELKEDAKPYHTKPFPILKIHELALKKKVNRLIKIGVLKKKKINNSQWAAPTFIIPNKNGTVSCISDFR